MDQILDMQVWGGQTLRELLTADMVMGLLGDVAAAIAILVAGYIFAGWLKRRIISLGLRYETLDDTLFSFLGNVSRYVVLVYAVLFVLGTFGVQTTSVVAVLGAAGLAIGLALQGTLSNVAAGVMIVLFRPIKLGDFVVIDGQMGTVKDITLNFTELATLANVQVIVPNSNVWGNMIVNYSAYDLRRAEWIFGVSYTADLKKAEEVIRDTILNDVRALEDPEPFVQVSNLGDFSVDFMVRVWCPASEYWGFKTDMTRAVKVAFDEAGIEIPFPTQTVHRIEG